MSSFRRQFFQPDESDLLLWFDAADTNCYTLSGSTLTQLRSKTPSTASSTTIVGTITHSPTGLNNRPTFSIPINSYIFGPLVYTGLEYHAFIVASVSPSNRQYGRLFSIGAPGQNDHDNPLYSLIFFASFGNSLELSRNSVILGVPSPSFNTPLIGQSSVSSSLQTSFIAVNGNSTESSRMNNTSAAFNTSIYAIGSNPNLADTPGFFAGSISEILLFNRRLSRGETQTVETYLARKWGLTGSLQVGHPGTTAQFMPITRIPYSSFFFPTSISNCVLWLDAADNSRFTPSSGPVTTWTDKAQGIVMTTQGTTANLTRLTGNAGINRLQSLRFDNSSSEAVFMSGALQSFTAGSAFIIFKSQAQKVVNWYPIFTWFTGVATFAGFGYLGNTTNLTVGPFTTNLNNSNLLTATTVDQNYLVSYTWNGTVANVGYSGSPLTTGTQPNMTGSTTTFLISGDSVNANARTNVILGEVILFNRVVSNSERQQIESYLGNKWSLEQEMPTTHSHFNLPVGAPSQISSILRRVRSLIQWDLRTIARNSSSFNPRALPQLSLWLDAADPFGTGVLPTTGTSLANWFNKAIVGGGNIAAVRSNAVFTRNHPTLLTITFPAVILNNNNYFNAGTQIINSASYSMFMVARSLTGTGHFLVPWKNQFGSFGHFQAQNPMIKANINTGNNYVENIRINQSAGTSASRIFGLTIFGDTSSSQGIASVDGVRTITNIASANYAGQDQAFGIGSLIESGIAGAGAPVAIHEIIVTKAALTNAQMSLVEGYLAWKWGLSSVLPTTHLYRTEIYQNVDTFNFTGADQRFVIPAGVTSLRVFMWGAGGGGGTKTSNFPSGGAGAYIEGTLTVTPGEVLTFVVGQGGVPVVSGQGVLSAYGGGGAVIVQANDGGNSGGGGRSAIRRNNNDIVIAGAGGGSGMSNTGGQSIAKMRGGAASWFGTANNGGDSTQGGRGGSQAEGGAAGIAAGLNGESGSGGRSGPFGGGGGSGFFGGGGGGDDTTIGHGGGGGSSFTGNLINTTGQNSSDDVLAPAQTNPYWTTGIANGGFNSSGGNGRIVIGYTLPSSMPFSLTSISGIQVWLDASDINTISTTLAGGTIVTGWRDKSINQYNVPAGASNRPAFLTNSLNGLPTIRFNGSSGTPNFLDIPAFDFGTTNRTAFFVIRNSGPASGTASEPVWFWPNSGNATNSFSITNWMTTATQGSTFHITSTLARNSYLIICYRFGTSAGFEELFVNSISVGTFTKSNGGTAYANATSGYRLGWLNSSDNSLRWYYDGNIAEVILTNNTFSNMNMLKTEGYLAWKWGLQGNLPVDHPWRFDPPGNYDRILSFVFEIYTGGNWAYLPTWNGWSWNNGGLASIGSQWITHSSISPSGLGFAFIHANTTTLVSTMTSPQITLPGNSVIRLTLWYSIRGLSSPPLNLRILYGTRLLQVITTFQGWTPIEIVWSSVLQTTAVLSFQVNGITDESVIIDNIRVDAGPILNPTLSFTGSFVTEDNGFTTITGNSTIIVQNGTVRVNLFAVGGGGSGGSGRAGGGGAGGLQTRIMLLVPGVYSVTIGNGAAATGGGATDGFTGSPTIMSAQGITMITANGGGAGSRASTGGSGGCGGGGGQSNGAGGTATQGFNGGNAAFGGGGGGGIGGAGVNSSGGTPGNGGIGLTYNGRQYGGGGGGSAFNSNAADSVGGSASFGGGAGGTAIADGNGKSATPNTGGGGGAASYASSNWGGSGAGGSGVFIINIL